jgi:hypothetical protein
MSNHIELNKALTNFAKADLALARKEGKIAVAQTKLGTLEVEYNAGRYTISAQGSILAVGAAAVAREFLVATYDVVAS